MRPDILLNTCVSAMRLDGHAPDAIAFVLAERAVDSLVAAGLSGRALDSGIALLTDAMRERADELRAIRAAAPLTLVVRHPVVMTGERE